MATLVKTKNEGKSHRLVARMSDADKEMIAQAAAITGQTISSFVLFHARNAAIEAFEIHNRIALNAKESRRFAESLLATPRKPSARMTRALQAYTTSVKSDV